MFLFSRNRVLSALSITLLGALSACNGGGGGGGGGYSSTYGQAWYDVYGAHCGSGAPSAGCNYYRNGDKIIDSEDPYYSSYSLSMATWHYTDSYGIARTWTGWGWLSPSGVLYDDWGRALNTNDDEGRDILEDAAEQEENVIATVGENLAARFELDADVGVDVARVLNDWATIGKTRARTDADVADFTKRLYGIDLNEVKDSITAASKGDKNMLNSVVSRAADNWSTTPETMKEILKAWYGKKLNGTGISL